MNIITNADVEKFVKLFKAGLKDGTRKEMKIYDSATNYDGINVVKHYFVSLEFTFLIEPDKVDTLFINEDAGLTNQIDEMLK